CAGPSRCAPEKEIFAVNYPAPSTRTAMTSRPPFLVLVSFLFALTLAAPVSPVFAQSPLSNPAALREQAPATYKARFDTNKGPFVVEVTRAWAPKGADRFYNL